MKILMSLAAFLSPYRRFLFMFIIVMTAVTFLLYGIDKYKAKRGKWRISEKALLLSAFLGGGAGALFGMKFFHHKTKHLRFRILVPLFAILQLVLIGFLIAIRYIPLHQ